MYVKLPVPPFAFTVAVPLFIPLQEIFVEVTDDVRAEIGCVMVMLCVVVHPFASVISTE